MLRKLSPLEAELLKDPTLKARIKFRFGGTQFPPLILFKVFTSTQSAGHGGVCYFSGKRMIKPASEVSVGGSLNSSDYIVHLHTHTPVSTHPPTHTHTHTQAAEDARRQMGNRVFYDQMFQDACHHDQLRVTDEMDVTTMKEYMQARPRLTHVPLVIVELDNFRLCGSS